MLCPTGKSLTGFGPAARHEAMVKQREVGMEVVAQLEMLKPWPNRLATQHKFWTCIQLTFNLLFIWPPTCVDLHQLAMICVDV